MFEMLAGICVLLLGLDQPVAPPTERQPGVTVRVYQLEGDVKRIPRLIEGQTPNADEARAMIDLGSDQFPGVEGAGIKAPFMTVVLAELSPAVSGLYIFRLTSDDGSRLTIGGEQVIDHDGRHGVTHKQSGPIELSAGKPVSLLVEHFDAGGGRRLRLDWALLVEGQAPEFVPVPQRVLTTEIDNARVVSPGVKKVQTQLPARPGDGVPVAGPHPAYRVEPVQLQAVEGFSPMIGAMAMLPDGRLVVGTFNPLQRDDVNLPDIESKVPDKLYVVSDPLGPGVSSVKPCADGLYEPLGLCVVGNDLYVAHRRAVTRLRDVDGDGFFEQHHDVAGGSSAFGWEAWNYHQFTFGLLHDRGRLYTALSTAMAPPGWEGMGTNAAPNGPLRGCVLEIDLASESFRAITSGVRTPNGLGFGPLNPDGSRSIFYADNQGAWMPSNNFGEVARGRFFGHFNNTRKVPKLAERFPSGGVASSWADRLRSPAAVDLVHNDLANSPTQSLLIRADAIGKAYAGQMLVGELTAGGIRRVALEWVKGQWQGAAFQFSQGFSVGVNRLEWGPKLEHGPSLLAGGIGAGGNWNWKGTRAGLDRMVPTGIVAFEMLCVRAMPDGFVITFTKPVDRAWLNTPQNFAVSQWTYEPTEKYGGEKTQVETLKVIASEADAQGERVTLRVPGLKAGRTVRIRTDPVSTSGESIWATEAFYNLNQIPAAERSVDAGVGVPPPADAVLLIGRSARTHFKMPKESGGDIETGRTQEELMQSEWVDVGGGDLVSRASFGDMRLHVEWYAPPGGAGQMAGNSGVYLQDRYEVQVLGTLPGERRLEPNEAASIYAVQAPAVNASTGPGTWQAYDIEFKAPRFEAGTKSADARMSMRWNGVLVHDHVPIPGPTGAAGAKGESAQERSDGVQIGPIRLQAHATDAQGPVRYRNVWVQRLDAADHESTIQRSGEWTNMLDPTGSGKMSLDAFVVRGGDATFRLEEDQIVGTTVPHTPNTFLVSRARFADFDLLVDVKVDAELNSGVQIRSNLEGELQSLEGLSNHADEVQSSRRSARLRGYQVEIDPGPRAFTGGIYDEGRRGWLVPLNDNPAARSAFRPGEWNRIQVEARGERIETWINGVPASTMFDSMDKHGRIALQVHGVGERQEPLHVRFRNVRIRTR